MDYVTLKYTASSNKNILILHYSIPFILYGCIILTWASKDRASIKISDPYDAITGSIITIVTPRAPSASSANNLFAGIATPRENKTFTRY